jgi:hypothetical protein
MGKMPDNLILALLLVTIVMLAFDALTLLNAGKILRITGAASTAAGGANVSISGAVALELIPGRNQTDFGVGSLDGSIRVLTTRQDNYGTFEDGTEGNGTSGGDVYGTCVGTTATCAFPLVVRNVGNVNCSINITASKSAATFIGGVSPAQAFLAKENISASCGRNMTGGAGYGERAWVALPSGSETRFCDHFDSTPNKNEIRIHLNLTIPADAAGTKSNLITLGATAASP